MTGHKGMFASARNIAAALAERGLLDHLAPSGRYPDYSLVLTGHSLGAGTATLLAVLLRPRFPSCRAVVFSPPAAVTTAECAASLSGFVTSVALGNDIIPRASELALRRLRDDLLAALAASKKCKAAITARSLFSCIAPTLTRAGALLYGAEEIGAPPAPASAAPLQAPRSPVSEPEGQRPLASPSTPAFAAAGRGMVVTLAGHQHLSPALTLLSEYAKNLSLDDAKRPAPAMAVAGRLVHLVPVSQSGRGCCGTDPKYRAIWADPLSLDRILVAEGMFTDHLPTAVGSVLATVTREASWVRQIMPPAVYAVRDSAEVENQV